MRSVYRVTVDTGYGVKNSKTLRVQPSYQNNQHFDTVLGTDGALAEGPSAVRTSTVPRWTSRVPVFAATLDSGGYMTRPSAQ
jgi:hypothetical protein